MLKVLKSTPKNATAGKALKDADLYDIVVCQVDWRVLCEKGGCETTKSVVPMARCGFNNAVWNSGPTCIANHLHGDKHPQCPDTTAQSIQGVIKTHCRKPLNAANAGGGDRLGDALGAYGGAGRRSGRGTLKTKGEPHTNISTSWIGGLQLASVCGCVVTGTFAMTTSTNTGGVSKKLRDTYAFLLHDEFTRKMHASSRHCVIPQSEELGGSLGQDVAEALGAHARAGRRSGRGTLKTKGA
jgi:hypothetical protein